MTVCCVASGPSLTAEDCEAIKQKGILTIAVNNSWQMARFAKYIYAGDKSWWVKNGKLIDIPAVRVCCDESAMIHHGTQTHRAAGGYNSGMMAIRYAIQKLGARRVILLGYDCSVKNGMHWHGPHVGLRNPDEERCRKWFKQFDRVAEEAKAFKAEVVNCSRFTELTVFNRMGLEEALERC